MPNIIFMRLFCVCIFCLITLQSTAQGDGGIVPQGEIRDAFGQPLTTKKEYGVEGSPFLNDMYLPGRITLNGKVYPNLSIKLNLEKNIVFFERDGKEMIPSGTVSLVEFFNATTKKYTEVYKNGFPEINNNTNETFYNIIETGKAILLKHTSKIPRESRQYGDASIVKRYEEVKSYYIFIDNNLVKIKKSESIIDALHDKKNDISKFISANKIKANREEDLKSVISYYNQL